MKRYILCLSLLFVCVFAFCGCTEAMIMPQSHQSYSGRPIDVGNIKTYQDLVSTCKPAVVGIAATSGRYQSIGKRHEC